MGIDGGCVCELNNPAAKFYKPSLPDWHSTGILRLANRGTGGSTVEKAKWRTHELTPDLCGKKEALNTYPCAHNGLE